MLSRKFISDKKIHIIITLFAVVVLLCISLVSNIFFDFVQENTTKRIEINKLYQNWIMTRQSVISYLTSEKKSEMRKSVNINIRLLENSISALNKKGNKTDTDFYRLQEEWISIKDYITGIITSDNTYKNFEKQLYWINNATNGFDCRLRIIMTDADVYYKNRIQYLWRFFCVGLIIVIFFVVNFIFYVRKFLKAMKTEREYKHLVSEMVKSREQEKKNMALEIHDTVIQNMTFSKMLCMDLVNSAENGEKNVKLKMLTSGIVNALQQIRDISYDIRPPEIAKDLKTIISLYVENWKIKANKNCLCVFSGIDNLKFTDTFKLNVYRIIQELLTNISKHSDAKDVKIVMLCSYPSIIIKVSDNSSGYNLTEAMCKSDGHDHSGLRGINERVKISKGEIKIKSDSGKGVVVSMTFPVENNVEL